ncbi:MAG: hypothetical protein AAF600_01895 [Bacteroidota bacterium]
MQIKDNYLKRNSVRITIVKIAVTVLVIVFISDKFQSERIDIGNIKWPKNFPIHLVWVFGSMILNWSLEAIRWRISILVFETISFKESLRIVLGGLALNWIFPFASGDALIRLITIKDKYQTTSAILTNKGIMLTITSIFGFFSLWVYSKRFLYINYVVLMIVFVLSIILWLFRRKISKFLFYFSKVGKKEIATLSMLSVLRYLVFVVQFFFLFKLFLPEISNKVLIVGIGCIFFFKSVIPSFFGGVGVRETIGILFFSKHSHDISLVVTPVFVMWIINNAIPSLIGLIGLNRIYSPNQSILFTERT